jgi:hypothetical protein
VTGTVIPPSERAPDAGIDARTDAVVLKCLAKDPEERFASADDFIDALRDCVGDRAFLRDAERLPGIREAGFDLTESRLDPFEARELSKTRRFRRDDVRRTRRLLAGLAFVVVMGAGFTLWRQHERSTTEVLHLAPATVVPHLTPPPASILTTSAAPAAPLPATPATSVPAASPAVIAHPAPNENKAPLGLHPGIEKIGRRIPLPLPPSQSMPSSSALPNPPPSVVAPTAAPAPAANPAAEAQALVKEAQLAWVRRHYALAIDRARSALALSPDLPVAHQIITLCSCALHRAEDAQQAVVHLDSAQRSLVRTLCEKDGVALDAE